FSSRRRHTRSYGDWSSDVCSSDLILKSPRSHYLLGTDTLGRDQLSRIIYGGRISLAVGAGVALMSGIIGTFIGAVAGYFGGRLEIGRASCRERVESSVVGGSL